MNDISDLKLVFIKFCFPSFLSHKITYFKFRYKDMKSYRYEYKSGKSNKFASNIKDGECYHHTPLQRNAYIEGIIRSLGDTKSTMKCCGFIRIHYKDDDL